VQLTPEAADILVEKYRILRQDDATGAGRHSYRITVRQLESMIRLSEAIARANCTAEITPVFVREAYTLLRQSIIHVEQDDIDFDEEELEGEREARNVPATETSDVIEESQDIEMSAAEIEAMDQMEEESSLGMALNRTATSSGGAGPSSTSRAGSMVPDGAPPPAPKRRMIITHDKYMTLQSLVVLHLSAVERETGRGVDRDELIDWYLELKESEIQDVDELEYEKELISKLLRKLVKVRYC
jgi:DNA replication licensing factor MCM6